MKTLFMKRVSCNFFIIDLLNSLKWKQFPLMRQKKTRFFLVNMSHCLEDGIANAFSATAVYYVDPVHPQIRSDLPHRIQSEISPLECQYV